MAAKLSLMQTGKSYLLQDQQGRSLSQANRFLEAIEHRGLSSQTVRAYGYDLLYLHRWLRNSKTTWRRFSQRNLLDFIAFQRSAQARPKSINRRLTTCEAFYRFCFDCDPKESRGVNHATPFYKGRGRDRHLGLFHVSKPKQVKLRVKESKPLMEILTPKDVGNFLGQMTRYRDLAIVYLMLYCGLRFSEILWLKLEDVNFNDSILKIHGKGNKDRFMPLPEVLVEILKKYFTLERPDGSQRDPVFVIHQGIKTGQPMTIAGLRSLFRHRRKASGVQKANPHRFRHTFASRMAAENVSLPTLQRMMGHADCSTTLQYIHFSTADLAREFHRAMTEIQKEYAETTAAS